MSEPPKATMPVAVSHGSPTFSYSCGDDFTVMCHSNVAPVIVFDHMDAHIMNQVEEAASPQSEHVNQSIEGSELQQAMAALSRPKRRGRKVGGGKGEKRTVDGQYSNNPHTVKARARRDRMNPYEEEVDRAKVSASSWVSKLLAKWKTSDEVQSMSEAQQKVAVETKRKELKEERELKFSTSSPSAVATQIMQKFSDELMKQASAPKAIVAVGERKSAVENTVEEEEDED